MFTIEVVPWFLIYTEYNYIFRLINCVIGGGGGGSGDAAAAAADDDDDGDGDDDDWFFKDSGYTYLWYFDLSVFD